MHPEHDPPTTPLSSPAQARAGASTLGRRGPDPGTDPSPEPPTAAIPIQQGARRTPTIPAARRPTPATSSSEPDSGPSQAAAAERTERRPSSPPPRGRYLLVPVLVGALVAVGLGAYGRLHEPAGHAIGLAGFSTLSYAKAWLASVAALFGVVQLLTGMTLAGRLLAGSPSWAAGLHRWSGRIAVLVSVPVAVQCLYALGFQSGGTRVWLHSILGCVFYGAFTTKMLSLSRPGTPRWAVPLLGGLVFTVLVVVWLTSALWLFTRQGLHL
jgi:Family of unknown function (DUF6529)